MNDLARQESLTAQTFGKQSSKRERRGRTNGQPKQIETPITSPPLIVSPQEIATPVRPMEEEKRRSVSPFV